MPPKKKKGGKKKKKKKQEGEFTVEDKYKKTLEEIDALKDHLSVRKEFARRSQSNSQEWKSRMQDAEGNLEDQQDTHHAVSADMTRQYKTMQTEMGLRIHQLETELARTRTQLDQTEKDLQQEREEKEKMRKEKDAEITRLNTNIDTMGLQYDSVLNEALNNLIDKIKNAKDKWEDSSTMVQSRSKQVLLDFGLNPLDL